MKWNQRFKLGAGAGLVTMLLGALMVLAPSAGADANDKGDQGQSNNGTVKVDGQDLLDGPGHTGKPNDPDVDDPDNDPHVTCGFQLEFFGFDPGQYADIVVQAHPPTGDGQVLIDETKVISDDEPGGSPDLDVVLPYELSDELASITPQANHGWHVKLSVTIYDADGDVAHKGEKHKVFWVEGCAPTGSLSIDKDLAGNNQPAESPGFAFTVSCTSGGKTLPLRETDASFTLSASQTKTISDLPVGASCTVTETGAQGATSTTYKIGTGDTTPGTVASGATIAEGVTTPVLFVNTFNQSTAQTGSLRVDKDLAGNDQPDVGTTFPFTVSCMSGNQAVALGANASFSLTAADTKTISNLPVGASCTVTETGARGATSTTYKIGTSSTTPGTVASGATIGDGTMTTVLFTNTFNRQDETVPTYGVTVEKLNNADGRGGFRETETADDEGDAVEFQVTIRNTGTGALVLRGLTDLVPGMGTVDLLDPATGLDCGATTLQVDSLLAAGSVTVCTFTLQDYAPPAGDSLTNTVTVDTDRADDSDDSTVETDEVEVLPDVVTPPVTPPVVTPPLVPPGPPAVVPVAQKPQVLGAQTVRALPRTGDETRGLAGAGVFLLALGVAMVLGSKRRYTGLRP